MIFSLVTQEFTMVFTWPPILLACGFSALIGLDLVFPGAQCCPPASDRGIGPRMKN
jgi:hypothetical protein